MATPRPTRIALLIGLLSVGPAGSPAQDLAPRPGDRAEEADVGEAPGTDRPGLPDWLEPPAETPIADSIEPAVERFFRENLASCELAGEGVPCFPVSVQVQGRQYSVMETLENLQLDEGPAPGGPPTAAEISQQGANPRPTSAGVGFDPKAIVCKTKQLLRSIKGQSRTYYLYRVWDEAGERAVLRDTPIDPDSLARSPRFRYVILGEFGDECAAVEAYLKATHEVRLRRERGVSEEAGRRLPSGDAPQ
jgi:hypothetical protein